jgi:hypothetical protein
LAEHIDMGGRVSPKVAKVAGGPGILCLFLNSFRKNYGCVEEVSKGDFNWREVTPYIERSRKIEELTRRLRR